MSVNAVMPPPAPTNGRAPRRSAPADGWSFGSLPIGRVAGVPLSVHWSWAFIVALLVWSLAAVEFPARTPGLSDLAYVGMAMTAAVAFFACLLAHELGHAVQARAEGMEIDGITLWVFGGVARFTGMFPSAGAELRIALAGPAVTAVLGAVLLGGAVLLPLPGAVEAVATWLGTTNLLLLGFNLLPALPLDGGRVLRALLWRRTGDFARATRVAGRLGSATGQVMVFAGVMLFVLGASGALWLALIGWFIVRAAASEVQLAELERILEGTVVADAMVRDPVIAAGDDTLQAFMDDTYAASRHTAYPVVSGGVAVGEVTFQSVAAVAPDQWPSRRVCDVMLPLDETLVVDEHTPLFEAAVELMRRPPNRALVTTGGRLSGLLSATDVSQLLELRRLIVGRAHPR